MPQLLAGAKPIKRTRAYNEGALLNQGNTSMCVAYAGQGFMNAAPVMRGEDYETKHIYHHAQMVDEWPGEDYDGTSVRALMKVMREMGYISAYVWGQSVDEATAWMMNGFGTIIIGTNWYASMDEVGSDGFIKLPGRMETPIGGHCYRINWYDAKKGGYLVVNSWGNEWGIPKTDGTFTGKAYLRRDDFERLLLEEGEITAATQVPIRKVIL
jgi:hypothetical protein